MKTLTDEELRSELRLMVDIAGSQVACAERLGISVQYMNDLLHGRREFGDKMAERMGYKRVFVEDVKGEKP